MNIYFTDSRSFTDPRFIKLARSTSSKPRRLVIFHGADEGMPYEALPVLLEAGRHFASVETASVRKPAEVFLNVGIAFGRKKPADQYSCLFSDAELEESFAGYGIKAFSPAPAPKSPGKKTEKPVKTEEPLKTEKTAEAAQTETEPSEAGPAETEPAAEPAKKPVETPETEPVFSGMPAPETEAPQEEEQMPWKEDAEAAETAEAPGEAQDPDPDLVTDFRQFKAMLGVRVHQLKAYRGSDDELVSDVISILWDVKKDKKEIADAKPVFLERFGEDGEVIFSNVSRNYTLFLAPMLRT